MAEKLCCQWEGREKRYATAHAKCPLLASGKSRLGYCAAHEQEYLIHTGEMKGKSNQKTNAAVQEELPGCR